VQAATLDPPTGSPDPPGIRRGWAIGKSFVALCLWLLTAGPAFAFGTVNGAGQNSEHERITRHALACEAPAATNDCFEDETLKQLAGGKDDFGAVGIPDRGELVPENKAHCDSGDYLDIPGYPHRKADAQAALGNCRAWMIEKLDEATTDAGKLVDKNGMLKKSQLDLPCLFVGQIKGRAKCNVIEDLGILMHASQDFYSHTNWADRPDPAMPVDVENPPGLGHTGRAPWLNLRQSSPFPEGLISGCFENPPEVTHCNYGGGLHRVKHRVVNKDDGTIDPVLGSGTTIRGGIADNFAKAATAAIDDTRDKWATLQEKLIATYGGHDGLLMACAITHDHPMQDCR
jgi:hypothetical protein